jgi:ADP-heptose:LPS heptosyltransferase
VISAISSAPGRRLPDDPREILVTAICPIGDTLFLTPALALLRRRYSRARITAVVSPRNKDVLIDNPNVDSLLIATEPVGLVGQQAFWRGVRAISRTSPDLIIHFSVAGQIVARLAGLRAPSLGLQFPEHWWLHGARSDDAYRKRHAVDHYFKVIEPVAPAPQAIEDRLPRFGLSAEDRKKARALLSSAGAGPSDIIVTMHTGGDGFNGRKRWAPRRFAQVANGLVERFNAHIVLIGGTVERPMSEEAASLIQGRVQMLAGKTSLKVTGALIEASAVFIGNDSSPLHIAAAVGAPSVGIYGPSDWQEFHPIAPPGYRGRVMHSDLPCAPCFRFIGNAAPWQANLCYTFACLKEISAPSVLEAATELLRGPQAMPQCEAAEAPATRRASASGAQRR